MSAVNARARAWKALGAVSVVLASASCDFPSPEACDLQCGEANACPEGFECQTATRRCIPLGSPVQCPLRDIESARGSPPSGGAARGGDAGPGGSGGDVGAAAGSPGDVGQPSTGGASGGVEGSFGGGGGTPEAEPEALGIVDASVSLVACTGAELALSLRASGGVGPYTWRLEAPPGIESFERVGDVLELTGVPTQPGALAVELEDAAGTVVKRADFVVHESPRIEHVALPAVCSGVPYEVQLRAAGGQADAYTWGAELAPAAASPTSLEELGLGVAGSVLSGELAPDGGSWVPLALALTVSDGICSSTRVLELDAVDPDDDACPSIAIARAPALDALPAPCLGNRYSEMLRVDGGDPPYRWRELSAPPGLSLSSTDGEFATIDGVAAGDGVLSIELTDQSSRTIRKSYQVRTRDTCWLAYVAEQPGPARLELVDGLLLERQPEEARRTLPLAPTADGVVDFGFSPDGRFIAYRLGPDVNTLRLELARLSDGEVQSLAFDASVLTYAWSPDSQTLAVAYGAGAQTLLGGVDMSALERAPLLPGTPFDHARVLASRALPSLDSELIWCDDRRLAFLARPTGAGSRRRLTTTALGAGGFEAAVMDAVSDFSDAARLLPGSGGVFVAEPETGLHTFFAGDGRTPVAHAADLVVSPSGALTGLARDGGLQLFLPDDPSGSAAAPFVAADGCTTLLAWASGRDRIACADERAGRNQVALFDAPSAARASLTQLALIPEPYLYPPGAHSGRRRLLSPSGSWFAFVSDDDLYVARSDQSSTRLAATVPTGLLGTRPGALAFSPDDSFLLVGAGNALALLDLARGQSAPVSLSNAAITGEDCSERFVDGASGWCGREPRAAELAWSSGSDLVSFRSSLGSLFIMDVSLAARGIIGAPIAPDTVCSEACRSSELARFQPRSSARSSTP